LICAGWYVPPMECEFGWRTPDMILLNGTLDDMLRGCDNVRATACPNITDKKDAKTLDGMQRTII